MVFLQCQKKNINQRINDTDRFSRERYLMSERQFHNKIMSFYAQFYNKPLFNKLA